MLSNGMRHIESFSIRFEDQLHECSDLGSIPEILVQPLKALLEALPLTYTALEVDTSGFERYTAADGTGYLCPAIATAPSSMVTTPTSLFHGTGCAGHENKP